MYNQETTGHVSPWTHPFEAGLAPCGHHKHQLSLQQSLQDQSDGQNVAAVLTDQAFSVEIGLAQKVGPHNRKLVCGCLSGGCLSPCTSALKALALFPL